MNLENLEFIGVSSPLMAAEYVPMTDVISGVSTARAKVGSWPLVAAYFAFSITAACGLFALTVWLFQGRWRLTGRG
jgi:hypothetical protein